MSQVSEDQRREDLVAKYGSADKKLLSIKGSFAERVRQHLVAEKPAASASDTAAEDTGDEDTVHIVFSCAQEDWKYATFLKAVFKEVAPDLVIKTPTNADKDRLTLMDKAQCVIAFLSPNYLDSPEQVEEFHIALCRHRISQAPVLFPVIIHPLPQKPTYFHLVPCPVNMSDSLWAKLATQWNVHVPMSLMPFGLENDALKTIPAEISLGFHEVACVLVDSFAQRQR